MELEAQVRDLEEERLRQEEQRRQEDGGAVSVLKEKFGNLMRTPTANGEMVADKAARLGLIEIEKVKLDAGPQSSKRLVVAPGKDGRSVTADVEHKSKLKAVKDKASCMINFAPTTQKVHISGEGNSLNDASIAQTPPTINSK